MPKVIDYYLSLNSPWTYLGSHRLEEMAERHGAEVRVKPVDFGVIFPQTGGLPLPKRAPARQAYRLTELERWRRHLDMPLTLHPAHFPSPDKLAAGIVVAAADAGEDALALAHAFLRAVWVEERNIGEREALEAIIAERGLTDLDLLSKAEGATIATRLTALTEEALGRGVFGAPTYVLNDELFWGQDRLEFLDPRAGGLAVRPSG